MDLYFKAAFVMICGAIFAVLIYFVSIEIGYAEKLEAVILKPSDVRTLDLVTTLDSFTVDKRAFVQFVIAQQSNHRVILTAADISTFYGGEAYRVNVAYDVPRVIGTETITIPIVITPLNSADPSCNGIEVTGSAGRLVDVVKDFVETVDTDGTVDVVQYTLDDGSLVLVCERGVF